MSAGYFDIGQVVAAAGKYAAASERAWAAKAALGAASLNPGGLGSSASAQALASALHAFHDTHDQVVSGSASALIGFAERLNGVAVLGGESVAESTNAANRC